VYRKKSPLIQLFHARTITIIFVGLLFASNQAYAANVSINASIHYQTIDGWGITHYPSWYWEGPKRYPVPEENVMNQIKNDLGINYIVNITNELFEAHEATNDDSDPNNFKWSSYNAQLSSMTGTFQNLKLQQDAGLRFAIGSHGKPSWLEGTDGNFGGLYEEFGEYIASLALYAKNNYGVYIPYIVLQIEPAASNNAQGWTGFSPAELRDAIKTVGARLKREGLTTKIIAPDEESATTTKSTCSTLLSDSTAKSYMPCIAYHHYDGGTSSGNVDSGISSLTSLANDSEVRRSGLPIWMTEWAMFLAYGDRLTNWVDTWQYAFEYGKLVHNCMVYGNTSMFTFWNSQYEWGSDVDGNGITETEGIFGPGVTDGKLKLKKVGYALTQYSKYIPPASKRIDITVSNAPMVYATAYTNDTSKRFTVVFINRNTSAVDITVAVSNITGLTNLKIIRTSATENAAEIGDISLAGNSFNTTLLGSSITTLTGNFGDLGSSPSPPTNLRIVNIQ